MKWRERRARWQARRQALVWRLGHVRRRAAEVAARGFLRLVIRVPRLRRLPRRLVAAVERALLEAADEALFDGGYYLESNPDVRAAGADPLAHYLLASVRASRRRTARSRFRLLLTAIR